MNNTNHIKIKTLREQTGAGWLDCKNAIIKANNNIDLAIEILKKLSIIKVKKNINKTINCGKIFSYTTNNYGIIFKMLCETDFVAKNQKFHETAKSIIKYAINIKHTNENITNELNENVKTEIASISSKTGENIRIQQAIKWTGNCSSYLHSNNNIGTMINYESINDINQDILNDICMHITAFNPLYISSKNVPLEIQSKELNIYKEQLINKKKNTSEKILNQILDGKLKKWFDEICLYNQKWIKNNKISAIQAIQNIKIKKFVRLEISKNNF